jgi:hypothetical protein
VGAGGGARLDDLRSELDERADGVADDLRTVEQVGERIDRVLDLDDVVLGGLYPGDLADDVLQQRPCSGRRRRTGR